MFLLFLFAIGITQTFAFIEGLVTNIMDHLKCTRWKAVLFVCVIGVALTALFSSNFGWQLFDMTEHYLTRYVLLSVGLFQCIAVGWVFEFETTSNASEQHKRSLRYLTFFFWVPNFLVAFYCNFSFSPYKYWGLLVVFFTTLIALGISHKVSGMTGISWYHEIVMCGTDKVAMGVTSLTHCNHKRVWWMLPFESYFGISIKFINPVLLVWIIFNNLMEDFREPYLGE